MKRLVVLLGLLMALSLVAATGAYANFGPHGGYTADTDSCAGCHRAHSSFSDLHFEERIPTPVNTYSLLVGDAGTMTEFCNACHGDLAVGASTNVVAGVFDSGPSDSNPVNVVDGVDKLYLTDSTYGVGLNGGGLTTSWDPDTSALKGNTATHDMDSAQALWGAGNATTAYTLTCTGCHDPHGSTNYRLLKDNVNGVPVASMVFSYEPTYPDRTAYTTGWVRYPDPDAITQMTAYRPQYTQDKGTKIEIAPGSGSLSEWCSACHTDYNSTSSTYDYGAEAGAVGVEGTNFAGTGVGDKVRHRHPVAIPVSAGDSIIQIDALALGVADARIPLEQDPDGVSVRDNFLGCLTCHYAHGSAADMDGWAESELVTNTAGTWVPQLNPGVDGVMATAVPASSSLLRSDNRGVCQRCHGK